MKSLKEIGDERKKQRETTEQRRTASLDYVMNDARGRDFVRWLLGVSEVERGSYAFDADMHQCVFNEGKRYVGLALLDRLNEPHHFEQYITLLREK